MIITGPQTQAYREGWERIFGKGHENTEETARMRLYDDYIANGGDPDDILASNPYENGPTIIVPPREPRKRNQVRPLLGDVLDGQGGVPSNNGRECPPDARSSGLHFTPRDRRGQLLQGAGACEESLQIKR